MTSDATVGIGPTLTASRARMVDGALVVDAVPTTPRGNFDAWTGCWIWSAAGAGAPAPYSRWDARLATGEAQIRGAWFRRRFEIETARNVSKAWLRITADSWYRVWIDGRLVARGPAPVGGSYAMADAPTWWYEDVFDLECLLAGRREHLIAVEVIAGPEDPTRFSRGSGALRCEIRDSAHGVALASDPTWQACDARGYEAAAERIGITRRQDLRLWPRGWHRDHDACREWPAAVVVEADRTCRPHCVPPLAECLVHPCEAIVPFPEHRARIAAPETLTGGKGVATIAPGPSWLGYLVFSYVRGHGVLSDLVGIYRDRYWNAPADSVAQAPLNFTYLDLIYDSFLAKGIRPFVELGFMPHDLASGEATCFWWRGNITPPRDYAEWRQLIQGLVSHLLDRYGRAEVRTWPFEVWNEPDVRGFWTGGQDEYFRLYRETVRAIKDVDPDLQVGGPATCPAHIDWITPFLEMCDREKVPVDFVSTHSYAGAKVTRAGEYGYQSLHPVDHCLKQFAEARARVRDSLYPVLPLHITEYNTSYSPRSPVHDTALNAAYLGRLLSQGGDWADSFSYWTFSDVFEENDVPQAPFHGGFGLVALRSIRKPTFHLFAFFRRLGDQLLYRDDDCIVTRRSDGAVVLAAWNPVLAVDDPDRKQLKLDLPLAAPEAVVTCRRVNEECGNAWNCWRAIGRPRSPSPRQLQLLHDAAVPNLEVVVRSTADQRLSLDVTLDRNEVCLVEVEARRDETPSYLALDDSLIPGYKRGNG